MKVSILINNYNYARFVGRAIDSALTQSFRDCEVIVVDDGSTDDSWRVIESYGSQILALRQPNGGQGAAYNALWKAARGEFVLFLDADDCLDHDAIAACVAAAGSGIASVQFRLRLIDEDGKPLAGAVPYRMHDGDVRSVVRRFGHYAGPPGSGNFHRARSIAAAFPLEAARWRRAADTVPFITAAFSGHIHALRREMGSYRLHSRRGHGRVPGIFGNIDTSFRDALLAGDNRRNAALEVLRRNTGVEVVGPFLPLPWSLRMRALSWRMERARHPYPGDGARQILRLQRTALRHWPGYRRLEKLAMTAWVVVALCAPRALLQRLAATSTSSGARSFVKRLLGAVH